MQTGIGATIPTPIRQHAANNPSKQKNRQMVETESFVPYSGPNSPKQRPGTIPAAPLLSKKELFYTLKPGCTVYRSGVLRQFFTPERMARCHIDPADYPHVRHFNFDQSRAILRELNSVGDETDLD